MAEAGVGSDVVDVDGLAGLECLAELGVAVEVHHVVADARVFVARHQAHGPPPALRQEDRRAVQPERLAEPAGDGLHDIDEVQRAADLLEDLDHGEQVAPLVLEGVHPRLEAIDVVVGYRTECGHGPVPQGNWEPEDKPEPRARKPWHARRRAVKELGMSDSLTVARG